MIALDDPIWKTLNGGYRIAYDASVPLRALQAGEDVWAELWEELHHQGDVDTAAYAAVPQLVQIAPALPQRDWNFYGLLVTIEIQRHHLHNPDLPPWIIDDYQSAWSHVFTLALSDVAFTQDRNTLQMILAVIALAKGDYQLGAFLANIDLSQLDDALQETLGWSI